MLNSGMKDPKKNKAMMELIKLPKKFGSIAFNKPDTRTTIKQTKGLTDIGPEGNMVCTTFDIKTFFPTIEVNFKEVQKIIK